MIILRRNFSFSASHRLYNPSWTEEENLSVFGMCAYKNGHGHNYKLEVALTGQVETETGMILNSKLVSQIVQEHILDAVDHRHLNFDVPWLADKIPTTEVFVESIWEILEDKFNQLLQAKSHGLKLFSITLWETDQIVVTKFSDYQKY